MTKDELVKEVAHILEISEEEIREEDTNLSEIWDSMGQISILVMLNEKFKISLTMDELVSLRTMKDIFELVSAKGPGFE